MENKYTINKKKIISKELSDLIHSLLKKNPKQRIGYENIE